MKQKATPVSNEAANPPKGSESNKPMDRGEEGSRGLPSVPKPVLGSELSNPSFSKK